MKSGRNVGQIRISFGIFLLLLFIYFHMRCALDDKNVMLHCVVCLSITSLIVNEAVHTLTDNLTEFRQSV